MCSVILETQVHKKCFHCMKSMRDKLLARIILLTSLTQNSVIETIYHH